MSWWRLTENATGGGIGRFRATFLRRELVPFLPAIGLAGYWFGGEAMVLLALTAGGIALLSAPSAGAMATGARFPAGLPRRPEAEAILDEFLYHSSQTGLRTACIVAGIDDALPLREKLRPAEFEHFIDRVAERLRSTLREADRLARLDDTHFAILLTPTPHPDVENMIQLAVRLQSSCGIGLPVSGRTFTPSIHVGICLTERAPARNGTAMLMAAEDAATEAAANGPGAIRVFSAEVHPGIQRREELADDLSAAIDNGFVIAFFQPQISTDTGEISGMLAVPHWHHRRHGDLASGEIVALAQSRDLTDALTTALIRQALEARRSWTRAGLKVGPVAVEITAEAMARPNLADRLKWDLERQDLDPGQICLVLQHVILSRQDEAAITRNLTACAQMGCQIDLGGFGSGPVAVEALRRAQVRRIHLPRPLVSRVDRDQEQQRIVAAIIAMAEGLEIETLAEGIATLGENAMLAQLGCRHLQGDAIAAPMPFAETLDWIPRHNAKLAATPRIPSHRGA